MESYNKNATGNGGGAGGERRPLLGASTTRTRPFTTPVAASAATALSSSPTKKQATATTLLQAINKDIIAGMTLPQNNTTTSTTSGGGAKITNTINRPMALDANRNMFQKQSRPRKTVAEFRKKARPEIPSSWTGRVGVHLHVDEINTERINEAFSTKYEGWNATNHFEVVRLWQTSPPYIGQELWSAAGGDWPLSEDEDGASTGGGGGGEAAAIDMTAAMPEIFLFSFGACVFWNFPNEETEKEWITKTLLGELDDCCGDLYKDDEIESAMDSVSFQYGGGGGGDTGEKKFAIKQDVCMLGTRDSGEKLAVSFALAKSSLLSLYELRVQDVIERNSHLPEEMLQKGRVQMSMRDMSREVGRLFLVKHGINLDQSLIDTPEEFWEDDRFESTYDITLKYLKINKRLDLVNNRLDMIGELHNKIMDENHTHHAVILEWIIIVLIVVEVLLDMLHLGFY